MLVGAHGVRIRFSGSQVSTALGRRGGYPHGHRSRACVKRTRFVTLWKIAVPHTTGSFRGDTLARHGVLGVVPTPRPQRGTLFAPRGPGRAVPRFIATMEHCDLLTAFSAASFLCLAIPWLPAFRPCSAPDAALTDHPALLYRLLPVRSSGAVRISQVPVKPNDHSANVPPTLV